MAVAAQRAMTPQEWGLLALLSLLWGGSYFFVGLAVGEIPPLTLVTLRVGLAAALLWASAPFLGVARPRGAKAVAAVLAIAAFSTALAFIVYFRILAGAGATNVLLVTLLTPATAVILGALFLHERLAAHQFLGFSLIAIGLAFIDGRLPRALFSWRDNPNPASGDASLPTSQKSR